MSEKQKMQGKRPQKVNLGNTISRLFKYMGKDKWRIIVAFILLIFNMVFFMVATYMLEPLINNYIIPKNLAGLAFGVTVFLMIGFADVLSMFISSRLMLRVAQNASNRIRQDLFNKMQSLPLRFFDTNSHGELMSRFTNDMDQVSVALEQSIGQLLASVLTFVFTLGAMLLMNWRLTLVTIANLIIMFFVSWIITNKSRKSFIAQQSHIGALNGYVEEMLDGEKVIKAFGYEERATEHFAELNENYRQSATRAQIFSGIIMPIAGNMTNISYALTASVGGLMIVNGMAGMNVGALAAFLVFARIFTRPLQQIGQQINNVFAALAGAERIFTIIDEKPEVDDGRITLRQGEYGSGAWNWVIHREDGGEELVPLKGDVRFNDVSFSYDGEHEVLKDMSLYAKPGQKIAFVGSTGAGKTTITNLINRFYDVQEGVITYDGIDVKQIRKADLRHSLGMVLQDTHLFTGTIADNIRYGRLDATDDEVIEAAKRCSAHKFIERLPDGYQTFITGDGGNLSQGQRQLLSIARAAVADPPVLILDEATSSIDTRTEMLIEKGMDALMEGRTVFVIAHRLSTVRNANAIMVLEHGEVIERGDHQDLINEKGRYYKLYTGQFVLD